MIYLRHKNTQILDINNEEIKKSINSPYLKGTMEKLLNIEYSNLIKSDLHFRYGIYCVNWFLKQKIVSIMRKKTFIKLTTLNIRHCILVNAVNITVQLN